MRKTLFIFCLVTGGLSVLAFVPGLITLGAFFFLIPGLILLLAPYLFIIGIFLLITDLLFGRLPITPRIFACVVFLFALIGMDYQFSFLVNRQLENDWQTFAQADHPWSGSTTNAHNIAIIDEQQFCSTLCERLLHSGSVQSVLKGLVRRKGHEVSVDLQQMAVKYHIERRDYCPAVDTPEITRLRHELRLGRADDRFIPLPRQLSANECLVVEPATLSASDMIVIQDFPRDGHQPFKEERWKLTPDALSAKRLRVYDVQNGITNELLNKTSMTAYFISEPFVIVPLIDNSGAELGILRQERTRSVGNANDLEDFFETYFSLPTSSATAQPNLLQQNPAVDALNIAVDALKRNSPDTKFMTEHPTEPAPSKDIPVDVGDAQMAVSLKEGLSDPTLPANSPKLMLYEQYLSRVIATHNGDMDILSKIVSDRRINDYGVLLEETVKALGPSSAPLAGPILDRIILETPSHRELVSQLSESFRALPAGSVAPVVSKLEMLVKDPIRRPWIVTIFPRLADGGDKELPILLALIEGQLDGKNIADSYFTAIAGVSGLCRLGTTDQKVAAVLFQKLTNYKTANNISGVEMDMAQELIHMGYEKEVLDFFTQPSTKERIKQEAVIFSRKLCGHLW